MKGRLAIGVGVLAVACAVRRTAPPPPPPPTAPSEPTNELLVSDCVACHTADLVLAQRLTGKQWTKTLDKMRTWGAPTEDDGVEPLLAYLATIPAHEVPPQSLSAQEANALFSREPDGSFAGGAAGRGQGFYADQCAPCHADDARGGAMGVALAGRHVLDRAPEFASVIRKGRGRMPDYAATTDAEVADLLAYLRSLPAPSR